GIAPAIAIQQRSATKNPRSTVGTSTEIFDHLKLLFARIGRIYSPVSGEEVKQDTVDEVVDALLNKTEGTKAAILSPLQIPEGRTLHQELEVLKQQGFTRIKKGDRILRIDKAINSEDLPDPEGLHLVIDRVVVEKEDPDGRSRIADSVQTAFDQGRGDCILEIVREEGNSLEHYSERAEKDGISFETPSVGLFSFNSPLGACPSCEGFGQIMGIDEDLVIPDKERSVYEDAVVCWKGERMSRWKESLVRNAEKVGFPIHRPIKDLSEEEYRMLWEGNTHFKGIDAFFKHLEKKSYKIQYRVMLSRYRGRTTCPDCQGKRLRKEASWVKVGGYAITELIDLPIDRFLERMEELALSDHEAQIAKRLLEEIRSRAHYLCEVGLHYLTLNRRSNTLSGGEQQRIELSRALGSSLVGSLYILDEPSIGLHPRDNQRLIKVMKGLRDLGNTVIVVEHDEEIIREADVIVDLGPGAGANGGELVFKGDHKALLERSNSLTTRYITGEYEIPLPERRRESQGWLRFNDVREQNLKGFDLELALRCFNMISGVSGSGKSTLVRNIIAPSLRLHLGLRTERSGSFGGMEGDLDKIGAIEFVDQSPIGRSSRSNPVTYVKAFDEVRELLAGQKNAEIRGYKPKTFSFNVEGGRCEHCEGEGTITVGMQFMADIKLTCHECKGQRYKDEVLEVTYKGHHIAEILDLTVDEAVELFGGEKGSVREKRIVEKLTPLREVGLGYLKLGQSSSTLSGGEAQRIKLASFLGKGKRSDSTLFIFDEPTTGLHFHDIQKLLHAIDALLEQGHSVLVIEHHPDMIKCADRVMDLGPEGGDQGGELIFEGSPEGLVKCESSYTGRFLKEKLEASPA
ncbi:MAG: excinuclease ABC subunit UvrA, partial [Flavobacteriales bacterium]